MGKASKQWIVAGCLVLAAGVGAALWGRRGAGSPSGAGTVWKDSVAEEEAEQRKKYGHRILKMVALKDTCYDVRYSPDGKYVAMAISGGVQIRDARTLDVVNKWEGDSTCGALSFHPAKPWIACGTWAERGLVKIRTWPQGDVVKDVETDTDGINFDGKPSGMGDDRVRSCTFSADGRYLIATTNLGVGATVYETETWTRVGVAKREGKRAFECRAFPKSPRFTCNFTGGVAVFPLGPALTEEQVQPELLVDAYQLISMDDAERLWAFDSAGSAPICVKEAATGRAILQCKPRGNFLCLEVSHGGGFLAAGGEWSFVSIWRIADGAPLDEVKFGSPIRHVRFSPDDAELLVNLGTALVRFRL